MEYITKCKLAIITMTIISVITLANLLYRIKDC